MRGGAGPTIARDLTLFEACADMNTQRLPSGLFLGAIGLLALSTACSTPYRVEYMEEALRQTSQEELIHKFGYPQRLKRTKADEQVWEYDFQGKGSACASYTLTFDQEQQLRGWERRACKTSPESTHTRSRTD